MNCRAVYFFGCWHEPEPEDDNLENKKKRKLYKRAKHAKSAPKYPAPRARWANDEEPDFDVRPPKVEWQLEGINFHGFRPGWVILLSCIAFTFGVIIGML